MTPSLAADHHMLEAPSMSKTTSSVTVTEVLSHPTVPAKTAWGGVLADQPYFATVKGSAADETFDVADLSARTQALMGAHKRGVTVDMGGGNDSVVGSAYGDTIAAAAGVNYVDGGANQGDAPGGAAALDMLDVYVADADAAAAVAVFSLDARSAGGDGAAFAGGYKFKVTSGDGETTYVKNVEQVNVRLDSDRSLVKAFSLIQLHEITLTLDQMATQTHVAIALGTAIGDIFNAATDISSATLARMDAHGRGIIVDTGAGDDRITGSAYGDYIIAGAGVNYVDGGANGGSTPVGGTPQDVLEITVASGAAANAVQVLALAGSADASDISAAQAGYSHKVVTPGETDYIKGIERVSVAISDGASMTFVRDILLAVRVQEMEAINTSDHSQIALVTGTAGADNIDLASGSTLLPASLADRMTSGKQGARIDGGSGDDTIIGTAYADNIRNGDGNSRVDGGANIAAPGFIGKDIFDIYVATQADLDAVVVSASDDPLYTWMVTYGAGSTQKDYLRNIEAVIVMAATGGGKGISLTVAVVELSGPDLASYLYLAWGQGTTQGDTFDAAADISAATLALMETHGRGIQLDTGGGNDTITGSAYGDFIIAGAGINYVDGGANGGTTLSGGAPQDVLRINVASTAAANSVQVVALAGSADAADVSAAIAGYSHKVVAPGETDYIKGIERVDIVNTEGGSPSFVRDIFLAVEVQELGAPYHGAYRQIAWVSGTAGADSIDLASGSTLLPASLADRMASGKQGAVIDGGSGDDIITGTAYADHIRNGEGNARIDGGAHNAAPGLFVGKDIFEITVPTQADVDAIVVSASDDPLYTWMVTYGAGSTQKDYLRNIEGISALAATGGNGRWIALSMDVHEVSGPDLANSLHLVWAPGTTQDDSFDAAVDISAATQALMATYGRGAHVRTYAGNDTITGSAYGDEIDAGEGVNHVDGGAHGGLRPSGEKAEDVLRVRVADRAAIDAVQVMVLTANTGSAQDIAEFNSGYTHKVVSGGATDYIRNIERIIVQDDNGGSRDVWLVVTVHEADLAAPNSADYAYAAWVDGTDGADVINLADGSLLSADLAAQMVTDNEGIAVEGGAGDDVVTGSSFSDRIDGGAGTNYIDGGGNGAALPDVLAAHAASKADFDAATVIQLSSASAGADLAAFNSGYLFKLVNGTTQVDYFRNIEEVQIDYWTDVNANGQFDTGEHGIRSITMTVAISGTRITGTSFGDTFVAATDLSAATLALMATTNNGISADMGDGDDTIFGSTYQDNINAGTGINFIDGGAEGVSDGGTPRDTLTVTPLSQANFDAFAVTELSSASTGADLAAFDSGYTYKVTSGAAETDYIKNVESVFTQFWNDANGNGRRDSGETRSKLVSLALGIFEERLDPANPGYLVDGGPIAEVSTLAYVTGTPFADTFDVATNLSATGRALMDSAQLGMNIDTGAGNDIIKTSAYADQIIAGTGVNRIDGGAGVDTLDVYVTSQAAALALAVQALSAASTGADAAAFAAGYLYKLDAGAEVDYLLNVEQVRVYLWNDKTGDGWVTHAAAGSATNDATLVVTLIGN
ncbi:MAG: hypothetical protein ABWY27_20845, partial [Telluria sp.]